MGKTQQSIMFSNGRRAIATKISHNLWFGEQSGGGFVITCSTTKRREVFTFFDVTSGRFIHVASQGLVIISLGDVSTFTMIGTSLYLLIFFFFLVNSWPAKWRIQQNKHQSRISQFITRSNLSDSMSNSKKHEL